MFYEATIFP